MSAPQQVESAFSRHKRRPGTALAATSWAGQKREIYTWVLTHDLMLLKRRGRVFYGAGMTQLADALTSPENRVLFGGDLDAWPCSLCGVKTARPAEMPGGLRIRLASGKSRAPKCPAPAVWRLQS